MKTIVAFELIPTTYIQIKFKNGIRNANRLSFFRKIKKLFPSISVQRIITTVNNKKVNQLIEKACLADPSYDRFDFNSCYLIKCPAQFDISELHDFFSKSESIEFAESETNSTSLPSSQPNQLKYGFSKISDPSPIGIDTSFAHKFKGGDGQGKIKFIDIEQGWLLTHESIKVHTYRFTGRNLEVFQEHGTAVLGVIMMQTDGNGGLGITPKVKGHVISQWRPDGSFNTLDAIISALSQLKHGDILLLEVQSRDRDSNKKFWPIEISEFIFQGIRLATALGIIVIEPAGNGNIELTLGNTLDNYSRNGRKILNREMSEFRDSGAIIVGASTSSTPHYRMNYSNFGNRIDCYAWGEKVLTTGNYPHTSAGTSDKFTKAFCGTSSAAAIVAGAAIAVQTICEQNFNFRLLPHQMRKTLSDESYNTISKNGKLDKIGVMPDLKKIIQNLPKIRFESVSKEKEMM
jgi:hypothetical protein